MTMFKVFIQIMTAFGMMGEAYARDCRGPGLKAEFKLNSLVFVARATAKTKGSVSFEVENVFKGKIDKKFDFFNPSPKRGGEETADSFEVGQSYFFSTKQVPYLVDGKIRIGTHVCDHIDLLGNISREDLDWLKKQNDYKSGDDQSLQKNQPKDK